LPSQIFLHIQKRQRRLSKMNQVAAVCLVTLALVSGGLAAEGYYFNYYDLHDLAEAIENTAKENDFLLDRAAMLEDQKYDLDNTLNQMRSINSQFFIDGVQAVLDRLALFSPRISDVRDSLKEVEADQASGLYITERLENQQVKMWRDIDELKLLSDLQDTPIAEAGTILDDTVEKAVTLLNNKVEEREDQLQAIQINSNGVERLTSTKKCYVDFVNVQVINGAGSVRLNLTDPDFFQEGDFGDYNVPKVTCGIQGFISKLGLDDPYSHGYEDERQNSALTVDCKAREGSVDVEVFDQSRGYGNTFATVYVEAQICSFYAGAGFLPISPP